MRYSEEILHHEDGETLAQGAQGSCGCPLPGRVQGQVGWSSEQPGLVEGVPAVLGLARTGFIFTELQEGAQPGGGG